MLSKDILCLIGLELELKNLLNYSLTCKRHKNILISFNFWYNKLQKDFGFKYKGLKITEEIIKYYKKIRSLSLFERWEIVSELGYIQGIHILIKQGVTCWDWGMKYAAKGGHKDIIDFFISQGANDWNGGMSGASYGHNELVDFFISQGANNWNTCMCIAAYNNHVDLVYLFISKGADDFDAGLRHANHTLNSSLVNLFILKGGDIRYLRVEYE